MQVGLFRGDGGHSGAAGLRVDGEAAAVVQRDLGAMGDREDARVRQALGDTPRPRWRVTGRVGIGVSVPHPESTIAGADLEEYEWGSFSAQAAAGVELRLRRRVSLAGEYKLTRTVQNVSVVHGSVSTPLTTHHLVTGIVVDLGAARE